MNKQDFFKRIETEIKISKLSNYTLRNYLDFNKRLLEHAKKPPEQINPQDIKNFLADNMNDKSSSSTTLFLSSIRFGYSNVLGRLLGNCVSPR